MTDLKLIKGGKTDPEKEPEQVIDPALAVIRDTIGILDRILGEGKDKPTND